MAPPLQFSGLLSCEVGSGMGEKKDWDDATRR